MSDIACKGTIHSNQKQTHVHVCQQRLTLSANGGVDELKPSDSDRKDSSIGSQGAIGTMVERLVDCHGDAGSNPMRIFFCCNKPMSDNVSNVTDAHVPPAAHWLPLLLHMRLYHCFFC
jgi:hypothetical protein